MLRVVDVLGGILIDSLTATVGNGSSIYPILVNRFTITISALIICIALIVLIIVEDKEKDIDWG